ncbi:MAG: RnfABCDGE type electron transport complex subunit D [Candidatus Woesearchaeota archaeon]
MKVSSSPHIRNSRTTQKIYLFVVIALVPAALAGIYFFGQKSLYIIFVTVISGMLFDLLMQRLFGVRLHFNCSALITSLLLALILPPTVPLWLPVIGVIFAIGIAKYPFGQGNNIFNPALVARVFLAVSFPVFMSSYVSPDTLTSASPLTVAKIDGYGTLVESFGLESSLYSALFVGNRSGSVGETCSFLIIAGGLFLVLVRVIDWRIPFFYLFSVACLALVLGSDVLFHLMAGGLLLGAFFMATDYVTSPITKKGRIIFAVGCGVLTVILRLYSSYPEGVAFSILLMNAATPLIDRFTVPRPFGR